MAIVKVFFKTDAPIKKAWIDGVRLRFGSCPASQGNAAEWACKELTSERKHVLQWIVRGAPEKKYTIRVAAPASVAKSLKTDKALGADRVGWGQYTMQL